MAGNDEFRSASEAFGDGLARICRLYGVSPLIGRLYGVLFLAPEPMSLDELCEAVSAAKSTVSVALRKLLAFRAVRRLPPRNDRRDYYEAVADFWEIFADVARLYLRPEAEMWRESSEALARAITAGADAPDEATGRVLLGRIENVTGFLDVFDDLLASVEGARPQRAPARRVPIRIEQEDA